MAMQGIFPDASVLVVKRPDSKISFQHLEVFVSLPAQLTLVWFFSGLSLIKSRSTWSSSYPTFSKSPRPCQGEQQIRKEAETPDHQV